MWRCQNWKKAFVRKKTLLLLMISSWMAKIGVWPCLYFSDKGLWITQLDTFLARHLRLFQSFYCQDRKGVRNTSYLGFLCKQVMVTINASWKKKWTIRAVFPNLGTGGLFHICTFRERSASILLSDLLTELHHYRQM